MSSPSRVVQQRCSFPVTVLIFFSCNPLLLTFSANAQLSSNSFFVQPKDRISSFIDEERRVTLEGNLHPQALSQNDVGAVDSNFPMQHMVLTLEPDPAQEAALNEFLQAQGNPESPYYHQWLTPEQYAERFGVSEGDANRAAEWLQGHGFKIDEIAAGRRSIVFSGNAGQVQEAFRTSIHSYRVVGELHHANAEEPQIPAALADVVGGVVSLHDFHSTPSHSSPRMVAPEFTSGGSHYLSPADFATIYDVNPLYQQSISGGGQAIAVVGRTNIHISDIAQFRSYFNLPASNPEIVVNGTDPGDLGSGEETEADLDLEWSGAVAKNATVKFVVSASTNSSDGIDLSAQYIVNHNIASVMSTSFSLCERWLGSSGNMFFNSLWQQAAAEGITVFVASGDSGAAGCDSPAVARAIDGLGVNGLCSTAYSVCVGGTEFNDTANPSLYWLASNAAGTQGSAIGYIPEAVWNESLPNSGLWAGGGGASAIYSKPAWQAGTGVPADGTRDVPDVSLTAGGHDGYLIVQDGAFYAVGGTSAASPSLAGIMALVVQHTGTREGNASPIMYTLASKQRSGGAAVFHDVTNGNNGVPGQSGYNATTGYDPATGLGSIDASNLIEHWADGVIVPTFQLSTAANAISVTAGGANTVLIRAVTSGGFRTPIALSISGLPAGLSSTFIPATLAAPGAGSSILRITAMASAKAGVYPATVSAAGGSVKQSCTLNITIAPAPDFSFSASALSLQIATGQSGTMTLTTVPDPAFDSAITLSVTGLPSGISAQFMPAGLVTAPGSGSRALTFSVASSVTRKSYPLTLVATGGGITRRRSFKLTVSSLERSAIQR